MTSILSEDETDDQIISGQTIIHPEDRVSEILHSNFSKAERRVTFKNITK